jgi:phenylpyruvate tautomerase PptA (4-oxalocrotonate tautomerase family)
MPFVRITHAAGALTPDQQTAMLHGVQDAVVAVEGEALRMGVGVVLETAVAGREMALNCLPFVAITLVRGALTTDQRAAMIAGVVEAVIAVEGDEARMRTWVVIEESVASGEWSIGGATLTLDALAALKEGRNPWA